MNERINVLYALSDKKGTYSKLAGTSICSLLENTSSKVTIHVLHDGSIKADTKYDFESMVHRYGQEIDFYNVREMLPEIWQQAEEIFPKAIRDERYTEAALYRLLAPQLLDKEIRKAIYLDVDTIIYLDILELWQEEVGSGGLAAVRETNVLSRYGRAGAEKDTAILHMRDRGVEISNYFNSGVMIFDLDRLRKMENLLLGGLKILAKHPQNSKYHDQSILNYYFAANLTSLPSRYNIFIELDKKHIKTKAKLEPGIYHYLGFSLGLNANDQRDVLFYKYFIKTPWCTAEFFCKFIDGFNQSFRSYYIPRAIDQILLLRRMSAALSCKSLVIATTEELMPQVMEILKNPYSLDDEEFDVEGESSPLLSETHICSLGSNDRLNLALNYDVENHVYLFFVPDYQRIDALLSSAGLKEGVNYLDGSPLLDDSSWKGLNVNPQVMFENI